MHFPVPHFGFAHSCSRPFIYKSYFSFELKKSKASVSGMLATFNAVSLHALRLIHLWQSPVIYVHVLLPSSEAARGISITAAICMIVLFVDNLKTQVRQRKL